ncbi:UMP-CMP kinase [Seminavis robusta]|uniref:UMP-CMP kinase n=1 Tax=Seminavis robusta TaxID=568900 RepID=A0A9N8DLW3_9STRA|nr:UMP-CMP kinase [Seminavis robusta]|eukprot:Sro232_g093900.1 UMP-CMP kinase (452) ;mRNA; r:44452-45911
MMPGGIFLQRTAAFVVGTISSRAIGGGRIVIAAKSTNPVSLLQVRGGGISQPAFLSSATTSTSLAATLSQTAESSTTSSDASSDSNDSNEDEEQPDHTLASMSIVGSSVQSALFNDDASLPYLDTTDCNEFRVLFVLGGPGAGKGTQSDLIKANYPCVHLSAGDLLRAETKKEESPHRELIENCLVSGNIVPVEISLTLLQNAMAAAANQFGEDLIFLVDGFPRNYDNLDGWIRCMTNEKVATVWGVLNYQCPLDELERRILQRAAEGSGRSDDNLQSARKRFATFERDTVPVVETLRCVQTLLDKNKRPALDVFDIRGDQSIEAVWKETQTAMNQIISYDVLTAQSRLLQAIQTQNVELYRSLCTNEWFATEKETAQQVMTRQEGGVAGPLSNAKIQFISGTKVAVTYDRVIQNNSDKEEEGITVQEKRIWSHQGKDGWKNIHFERLPQQ